MAELEKTVLGQYGLTNPYPTQWPSELDESDDDETANPIGIRRSRSRYSALERSTSERKSLLVGSQKTGDGRANLVKKDEPDPLGAQSTIIQTLSFRGLPVDQDTRMRNKFLLSSTTFSPQIFLSQTHANDTTDELEHGLNFLSQSIDQKSASLKDLVQSNFALFVRAKATIDNVYAEMRSQGAEPEPTRPTSPQQSRRVSRQSGAHFRNFSRNSDVGVPPQVQPTAPPPKNALRKETEYGVQGIKAPLLEVSQRAEDVWGPALGGREREASLKAIVEAVDRDRALYGLGGNLSRLIKQKDYGRLVEQYNLARTYSMQAKQLSDRAVQTGQNLNDEQVHKILVTARMWSDVKQQVSVLKSDIWTKLSDDKAILPLPGSSHTEEHMELIRVLLELGVEDNPIWVWLRSRYNNLKNKINVVVDRSKVEIEILRRRLAARDRPPARVTASYLRQAIKDQSEILDTEHVVEFWNTIVTYVTKLLSLSSGLLGEVVDFWNSAQSFIGGNNRDLPEGFEGQSRKHHHLSSTDIRDLQNGAVDLVAMIRDAISALFTDPPTDDLSSLLSPEPESADTPNTPLAPAFSPSEGRIGSIDAQSVPAPSAKKGEVWEDFSFWPPHSNSLSAVHYLRRVLALIGTGAGEMASLKPVAGNIQACEKIKVMVGSTRERSMWAICDAWGVDAESCRALEDWTRPNDKRDQTNMPQYFSAFERKVLNGMQQVLYYSEATAKHNSRDIITSPQSKLLQMVRQHFVSSIYKALTEMMENAENPAPRDEDEWIRTPAARKDPTSVLDDIVVADTIDASNRSVRMLLTLSNLKALRNEHVPLLIQTFESSFSVHLSDESMNIRQAFGQIDNKLFQSYTRPMLASLTKMIKDGINSPSWAPNTSRPDQVRPYVYAALMTLVTVHTDVSTTISSPGATTPPLLTEILSYLLEVVSQALLDGFRDRRPNTYNLPALMQATLDTEFIAQTMSQYSSEKASNIQGQIYMELDKRTSNDARARLQQELGDMRVVLKKLRESSRNSFACFKRPRTDRDRGRA